LGRREIGAKEPGELRQELSRSATIRDVAAASGVSVGTVSRTLNSPETVRPATLERVRAAIQELGFQPDARAQNMRRRNTLTVGFIVNDISNPLHAMIFEAAETELREHGYSLQLVNTGGKPRREAEAIDILQHGRVDGLIMTLNNERDPGCRERLERLRVPLVLLDREPPIPFDAVLSDHASGMRKAVTYLIELGHRRIGLITGGPEVLPGRERVRGFMEAFATAGVPAPVDLIRAQSFSADFGLREATTLLQRDPPPTALIAGGNQILVGILRAVQQRGIDIPRQLSLITCDRTDITAVYPGPISVIDREVHDIGRTAAQLLLERIGGVTGDQGRRISFPTKLVLGGSCAPPMVG
jgi:LacI family transcriptional regulator